MGASGNTTIDFGAFPGASAASVVITGQTGIVADSLAEAWLRPVATADHSADEHMLETIKVFAGNIAAGVGFTIYGFNTNQLNEPVRVNVGNNAGGQGTLLFGQFTVAWVWN